MNALDLAIIATAIGAGLGGWRLGLVARVFAWAGVFTGLAIGVNFVPKVVTGLGGNSADDRIGVALLFLLLVASIGQAFGLVIGLLVHRVFPIANPLPLWDRVAGATAGVLGLFVLTWLLIPSLATAQGWPSRMARDSRVVAAIQQVAPGQPAQSAAWGLAISDAPYPSVLNPLDTPPDPGRVPTTKLSPAVDAAVRRSIVKVTGEACNQIQDGSGWVESRGIVVTNAHVVAGERATSVIDSAGDSHPAVVIDFDSVRDIAVLSVPGLTAPGLSLAIGSVGDEGAVYGHPLGGALKAAPARIGEEIVAVGTNIYRTSNSRRHVYVLAAVLAPGDSGGALVNRSGAVVGVAFAIDPGRKGTSYALTNEEVQPALDAATSKAGAVADTGACLVE
jgi:S1-C subfamily serine protease